ncbi:hypothetical protein AB0D27_11205 [Streptomyces sp. NPDC048415]|uniref:hypothetical protein n=1 Tax=Streptomyces sp. NPDC048415 TaxID=3154822 RepID=UPI00343CCD74
MTTLSTIAFATALVAVLALAFNAGDSWFCALIALACLTGGCDAVYRGLDLWAFVFLLSGTGFTGAAVHAAINKPRRQQPR